MTLGDGMEFERERADGYYRTQGKQMLDNVRAFMGGGDEEGAWLRSNL